MLEIHGGEVKRSRIKPSRKPIAHRSAKMQAKYDGPDGRKALVARLLTERPRCERCKANESQDLHERLRRSAGGDILDETGIVCLCRACHSEIHNNVSQAYTDGWLIRRWGKHEE